MKYIEKWKESQYCYRANHAKLTEILLDNNITVRHQGASCYPDRNYCIIEECSSTLLESLEEQYIEYLKAKFLLTLTEVPNTNQIFYTRRQYLDEAHKHTEPVIRKETIIPICLPNFNGGNTDSYRDIGYIDIQKIAVKRHIDIVLPEGWYKYACIGPQGNILDSAQKMISDIVGFSVRIHYHYATEN